MMLNGSDKPLSLQGQKNSPVKGILFFQANYYTACWENASLKKCDHSVHQIAKIITPVVVYLKK